VQELEFNTIKTAEEKEKTQKKVRITQSIAINTDMFEERLSPSRKTPKQQSLKKSRPE
jgi:hypothetical protein